MKKLFFFRSFNGESNQKPPPSAEKQIDLEKSLDGSLKCNIKKQSLRRSMSFSSGSVYDRNVLDIYIDGEKERLKCESKRCFKVKNSEIRNCAKHPSREHYKEFTSPSHVREHNPESRSSRKLKGSQQHFLSKDQLENGHESPRKIARGVVERLSQRSMDEPVESINDWYNHKHEALEDVDYRISQKLKEAEERVIHFSEELEQDTFFLDLSVPSLIQTIRNLAKDRLNVAIEVPSIFREWIADRNALNEELERSRTELDAQTRTLEKEKHELQSTLEMELDRRSSDWILKLEKYEAEEHRLRERVRQLAEHNVALQREVLSFSERDADAKNVITSSEKQLGDLRVENEDLQRELYDLQEKYRIEKEARESIQINNEEKVNECRDLHISVTRLQRTCVEQEKSIDGLRGNMSIDNFDSHLGRLQIEQMRLTGLEQSLRKEVETYKLELDSVRHENVNLLQRLKGTGNGGSSTFKLENELWNRVNILQNQGLSLLVNSAQLCGKLLTQVKRSGYSEDGGFQNFVIESEVKLQGFKRGIENLSRCLLSLRDVLQEKAAQSQLCESNKESNQKHETNIRAELRAETLLTNLLRDKLYCKDLDMEQLQAELAAAVRGIDILKCETQNAHDSVSCVTHKMKDLELQMMKKDENINQLENDLQECKKELAIVRGLLPKVKEERDHLWNEVKQYNEKNMLLNSEINVMKKKVEALDEDILFKVGQITILKDSIGKPFNLLGNDDCMDDFLLE